MNSRRSVLTPISLFLTSILISACNLQLATIPPSPFPGSDVGPGPTPIPATLEPRANIVVEDGITFQIPNLTDGGELVVDQVDDANLPLASIDYLVSGAAPVSLYMDADGLYMNKARNDLAALRDPFAGSLTWTPWHGNGEYELVFFARFANESVTEIVRTIPIHLRVRVTGIDENLPTVADRISQLYQEQFSLDVPDPVFMRYAVNTDHVAEDLQMSRWVSAAYIDNKMYSVALKDDGSVESFWRPIGYQDATAGASMCRPAGEVSVLIVFVDYHNTDITEQDALAAAETAEQQNNQRWEQVSRTQGAEQSLLSFSVTGSYISQPPNPGQVLTIDQIRSLTPYNPAEFDLVIQLDLDAESQVATIMQWAVGFGGSGCDRENPAVNIYFNYRNMQEIQTDPQLAAVFDHEWAHSAGWMHWWPTGFGSGVDEYTADTRNPIFPGLLYGWVDSDHDGVVEIIDPTPYGRQP